MLFRSEDAALNTPNVVFSCRTEPHGLAYTIVISVINAGGHSTEIVKGEISLQSREYPEASKSYVLTGQKIAGRGEHIVKLEAKASFVHSLTPGVAPAEIICKAVYTRPDQDNGHAETTYQYSQSSRNFIVKK